MFGAERPEDPVLPAEVEGLVLEADDASLTWKTAAPRAGSGTVHDVLRGELTGLPVGSGPETCVGPGVVGTSITDPLSPGAGVGFWYLVRGRNACGGGTWGLASDGTPRVSAACP